MSKKKKTVKKSVHNSAQKSSKTIAGSTNTRTNKTPLNKVKSTAQKPCNKKGGSSGKGKPKKPALNNKSVAKPPRKKNTNKAVINKGRTADGKVPKGRTLSTHDKYLPNSKHSVQQKDNRPLIVIETNKNNDLAVVPTSSRPGKNRTRMKKYQQGETYFKHFVEIEDNEGKPIRINNKFRENHPNMDVSEEDIEKIRKKVFDFSKASTENQNKMKKFRK